MVSVSPLKNMVCLLHPRFFCSKVLLKWNRVAHMCSCRRLTAVRFQNPIQRCFSQPTFHSHPYLMKEDDVTPGLSKQVYRDRRDSLLQMICMEKHDAPEQAKDAEHVLIVLGASINYMTQDIPYPFHQNTNFLYLTGFQEPDCCLVMETVPGTQCARYKSTLFVQKRDPIKELWNGASAGVEGAVSHTGVDAAEETQNLGEFLKKYLGSDYTIWYDYHRMTNLQMHLSQIRGFLQQARKQDMKIRPTEDPIHELRNVKSPEECRLMAASCDIISEAFVDAMSSCYPGINESEIHAQLEYTCKKRGGQMLAFPPVVAGGDRANTLHYVVNDQRIEDGSLVLVDVGARYYGYVSDVTRTWPVNGKFSAPQRELYEAVLRIQHFCISKCKPGVSLDEVYNQMSMAIVHELFELGILKDKGKPSQLIQTMTEFCPHHVGHWLGMDVHDTPGIDRSMKLLPGMVVTIEPGLYIRQDNHKVDPKYHGMGIRIEDDVLITENEPIVLSSECPKSVEDIERIITK